MPPKNRVRLRSNFKAVKDAGGEAIQELIEKAIDQMHDTASQRLEKGAARRGYNLPREIKKETSDKDGKISYEPFYGRWFEYGTASIPALSFMRPGHRAGRKVVKDEGQAQDIFQKWMNRKARIR